MIYILTIWNRRELVTVLTMQEQADIVEALRASNLDYSVKAVDLSSPSTLNPGSRTRCGTYGLDSQYQYEYIIYVKKKDYSFARQVIGLPENNY